METKSFGCCAGQLCITSVTASSYLKWCPHRVSFRGRKKWIPLGVNCGEYGRWVNTFSFKSCICFMLWQAVWCQALSCCRHTRRQQTMEFSLSCWLKLIPEYVTVPDSVHKAVPYCEFYTVFQFFIWVTFVGGIDMCVCVCACVLACTRTSMCGVYLHFF